MSNQTDNQDEFSDPIERFIPQGPPQQQLTQQHQAQLQAQQTQQAHQQHQAQLKSQQQEHFQQAQLKAQQQEHFQQAQQLQAQQQRLNSQEHFQQAQLEQMAKHQVGHHNVTNQQIEKLAKESFTTSLMNKFKSININNSLRDILIIASLFIIFSNILFKNILGNYIPFINVNEFGDYNTTGLLFVSLLFALLYIIIKMLIDLYFGN